MCMCFCQHDYYYYFNIIIHVVLLFTLYVPESFILRETFTSKMWDLTSSAAVGLRAKCTDNLLPTNNTIISLCLSVCAYECMYGCVWVVLCSVCLGDCMYACVWVCCMVCALCVVFVLLCACCLRAKCTDNLLPSKNK